MFAVPCKRRLCACKSQPPSAAQPVLGCSGRLPGNGRSHRAQCRWGVLTYCGSRVTQQGWPKSHWMTIGFQRPKLVKTLVVHVCALPTHGQECNALPTRPGICHHPLSPPYTCLGTRYNSISRSERPCLRPATCCVCSTVVHLNLACCCAYCPRKHRNCARLP